MGRLYARVPCPFCGTETIDLKRQQHFGEWAWCQCIGCGARGPRLPINNDRPDSMDPGGAIRAWNGAEVRKLPPKVLSERRPALRVV